MTRRVLAHQIAEEVGEDIGLTHRILQRVFDGIVEVFNLFNHVNYGNYVTSIGASNYGAPVAQDNVAYKPRQLQLGFRATF